MKVRSDDPVDWLQLARAAQGGGSAPVDRLLTTLRPRVVAWARGLTGDFDAAEDLVQEVLLRVEAVLPEWGAGGFLPWVHRITVNLFRDRSRVQNRRAELMAKRAESGRNPHVAQDVDPVGAVATFVTELSEAQRTAFQLVDLDGWSIAEVASAMGVAEPTVRVHLMRARRTVRARILEEWI